MSKNKLTYKKQILARIKKSRRNVFLRQDFLDLVDNVQLTRILASLIKDQYLIKVGYGLYAKACFNEYTQLPMPSAPGGFSQIAKESLNRLNIDWIEADAIFNYRQGLSEQVPMKMQIYVTENFNRSIACCDFELIVEKISERKFKSKKSERQKIAFKKAA